MPQAKKPTAFEPFANDSQVLTLVSGDDEFSVENGTEELLLSGLLVLKPGDAASRKNALALRELLDQALLRL